MTIFEPIQQIPLDLNNSWAVFIKGETHWLAVFPDEAHANYYVEVLNHRELKLQQTPTEYTIWKVTHKKGEQL